MPAYVIAEVEVLDEGQYAEYRTLVPATLEAYGGRFIVRGGAVTPLEGDWNPERIVVIEFESVARARAWWSSEEYRAAKSIRQRTSRGRLLVVEGVPG